MSSNNDNKMIEALELLAMGLEAEHDGYLLAIDDMPQSQIKKRHYDQLQAMYFNYKRAKRLALWLKRGRKIK